MSFMDTPRGHILKFLWKQAQGNFLEMSLEDIKAKLVSCQIMTAVEFDTALAQLENEGHVKAQKLDTTGLNAMEVEYKQYLSDAKTAAPLKQKEGWDTTIADFDAKQLALKSK